MSNNVKKIAVCYSGEVREKHKECRENFLQFVSQEHDTFISTWSEKGGSEKDNERYDDSLVSHDELLEIYQPQNIAIQSIFQIPRAFENNEFDEYFKKKFCQQYHVYKSDLMRRLHEKENGIEYDLIIKTRPDVYIIKQVDVFKFDSQKLNFNTGYLRGGQPWQCWKNLRYPLDAYKRILENEQKYFYDIENIKRLIGNSLSRYGLNEYHDLIMDDLDLEHHTRSVNLNRGRQVGAVHDALSISNSDNSRFYSVPFLFYLKWLTLGENKFINPFIDGHGQRLEISKAYGYHDVMTILSYYMWKYNVHHLEIEDLRFTLGRLVK